ncbi:MAG TPA: hypothetical protein VMT00_10930 [Thermoanaerobaculia bacterium]|nr:hypothetical protein [Thermoanaerobaculia bacterium]
MLRRVEESGLTVEKAATKGFSFGAPTDRRGLKILFMTLVHGLKHENAY